MISDASRSSRPGGSLPAIILFRALRRTSYRGGGKFANPLSAVHVRCPNMGLRRRTDDDQRQKVTMTCECVPPLIGRTHVLTPVTNAHLVCRLLLHKHKNIIIQTY